MSESDRDTLDVVRCAAQYPAAAERARYRYGCFEDFAEDTQAYALRRLIGSDGDAAVTRE